MKRMLMIFCGIILLTSTAWAEWGVGPVAKYNADNGYLMSGVEVMVSAFDGKAKAFGDFKIGDDLTDKDQPYEGAVEVILDSYPKETFSFFLSGGANMEWLQTPVELQKAVDAGLGFGVALHWFNAGKTKTSGAYLGYQGSFNEVDQISLRVILAL